MIKVRKLIWDEWNVRHIARHGIIPDEVEYVCKLNPLVQEGKKGRLLIIGPTKNEKTITVILDAERQTGVYYPVTARKASKKERRVYLLEKGGEEK